MKPVTALRVSQGAAAFAALLMVWSAASAFQSPAQLPSGPGMPKAIMDVGVVESSVTDADVARTVAQDPFSVDRVAPPERYRIGVPAGVRTAAAPAPAVAVVLVGTVIGGDGKSFAMCQVGQEPPRVVYVGQRVGSLKLERVTQGSAVFADSTGKRTTLVVPKGGS